MIYLKVNSKKINTVLAETFVGSMAKNAISPAYKTAEFGYKEL